MSERIKAMRGIVAVAAAVAALVATAPTAFAGPGLLKIGPKQIDFGARLVGTENYEGATVTNKSRSDVLLHVSSNLWDDFGFGLMPGSTCPALGPEVLEARQSCRAVVRFSPTEFFAGIEQPGLLTVTATDPATGALLETREVPVSGRGALP